MTTDVSVWALLIEVFLVAVLFYAVRRHEGVG